MSTQRSGFDGVRITSGTGGIGGYSGMTSDGTGAVGGTVAVTDGTTSRGGVNAATEHKENLFSVYSDLPKVYISGPIGGATDIPHEEKIERFHRATNKLTLLGYRAINPVDIRACVKENCNGPYQEYVDKYIHSWDCYLRYDLIALVQCDSIAMLPRWEDSPGAQLELHVAEALEFEIIYLDKAGDVFNV